MRRVPRLIAICLCAALLSSTSLAKDGPTPYPTQAGDWPGEGVIRVFGWMKDNRESFWRQRDKKQGTLVLAGDSLLGNWRTSQQDLEPRRTANRAIGGDVSRGLLFRLQEDVLDLNPSGIVLLIGGNDLSALQPVDQTTRNIKRMLDAIQTRSASLPVILCTLPPRDSAQAPIKQSELIKLNANIRALAARYENVELLDLYPVFATADGKVQAELFTADRLHISAAGYKVLKDALSAKLEEWG